MRQGDRCGIKYQYDFTVNIVLSFGIGPILIRMPGRNFTPGSSGQLE
jgi:hypothetical protein